MKTNQIYISEEIEEIAKIFYKHGRKIGESLKDMFKSSSLDPNI